MEISYYVAYKITKTAGILCKARHFLKKDLVLNLYLSLIYPHLIYGYFVWGIITIQDKTGQSDQNTKESSSCGY